jgi:pimeloyl-ACP methyl ester carboxylesterase
MITITKVGSLVKIDGIEGHDNVYESISNFQGARMSADGTQLSLQIGEVNIGFKDLSNFTIGGTVPTNAATVQSALATVFPSAAPATALPTETVATYAAMTTFISSDPTTKRDFFITADETNLINGVAQPTRYSYNGTRANRLGYFSAYQDNIRMAYLGNSDQRKSLALAQKIYADTRAGEFIESWTNFTSWSSGTALQISGGKVYSVGQGGNSGINHAFALTSSETLRFVVNLNLVANLSSGGVIIGVSSDTAGGAFTNAATKVKGIYFQAAQISAYDMGAITVLTTGTASLSGLFTITVIVDLVNISVVAVSSDGTKEYRCKFPRSVFSVNNIAIFNSDSRQLTGHNIGMVAAVKGVTTISPRTGIEDQTRISHWTTVTANSQTCGIKVECPSSYDPRIAYPLAICFHGNGSDENHFFDNANGKVVADALLAAGYIVLTAAYTPNSSTWGAQPGLDVYYQAYKFARDNYSIGPVVLYANSMGGIESLLTLAEKRIPGVVAWVGTSPTCNLAACYTEGAGQFTGVINTAYSISGGNYATQTVGHDPMLKSGDAFRGVPMLFLAATDDTAVLKSSNTDLFSALVTPFAQTVTVVSTTGGHSFSFSPYTSQIVAFFNTYIAG